MVANVIWVGPVAVHLYGLCIGLGVVVAVELATRFVRAQGSLVRIKEDDLWQALAWVTAPALVGARLYHVVDLWQAYYVMHPEEIAAVWQGGLAFYGGVVGGFLGLAAFCWRRKLALAAFLDVVAMGLPGAQAVGRLGNYVNQELYGLPTRLPWGIYIDPAHRLLGYERFEFFHPLFAYEALWSLVTLAVLWAVLFWRRRVKPGGGVYVATYLIFYAVGRFLLEYLRIEPWSLAIGGVVLTTAQWVGVGIVLVAGIYLMYIMSRGYEKKKN